MLISKREFLKKFPVSKTVLEYHFIFLLLEIHATLCWWCAFRPSHNINLVACRSGLDRVMLTILPLPEKHHIFINNIKS